MNTTLSVVKLDLITIRQYLSLKNLALYAGVVIVFGFMFEDFTFALAIMMVYGMFYCSYPFVVAEKTQMDLLYSSLPIRRNNLVYGRYLFALCMNLFFAAFALVLVIGASLVLQKEINFTIILSTLGACFLIFSLVEAIQLPIYFKVGYTKAKIIAMMPLLLLPLAVVGGSQLFEGNPDLLFYLERIVTNPLPAVCMLVLILVIFTAVSIGLSCKFYQTREF